MIQTLALLIDGYRELNAKRLFWIVLALSGLIVAVFAAVGIDNGTLTILWFHIPRVLGPLGFLTPAAFYKALFVLFGVQTWLSWIAVILAVVSTAGIFPDFLAGGSVDLYLSKPISRVRLFATKYVTGLLFVALQVSVFSAACFLVLGIRGGSWVPSLFLAVPAIVLMFSYLFAVSTLLGVLTRSTVASMLLTLLFWFLVWAVQTTEAGLLTERIEVRSRSGELIRRIHMVEAELAAPPAVVPPSATTRPATAEATTGPASAPARHPRPADDSLVSTVARLFGVGRGADRPSTEAQLRQQLAGYRKELASEHADGWATAHRVAYSAFAPLPKTGATVEWAVNRLLRDVDLPWLRGSDDDANDVTDADGSDDDAPAGRRRGFRFAANRDSALRARRIIDHRGLGWDVGTSLGFEAVVLGFACWRFNRRDY